MRDFIDNIKSFLEDVKTFLIRLGIGLIIYFGWITLISSLIAEPLESSDLYRLGFLGICIESLVFLWVVLFPIVIFVLIKGFKSRCPKCKKLFSMKEIETRMVARKPEYVTKINNTYSTYDGRVTQQTEQRVLGTRKTYKTLYVCKRCNAEKFKSYSVATDEVWQE